MDILAGWLDFRVRYWEHLSVSDTRTSLKHKPKPAGQTQWFQEFSAMSLGTQPI